MAEEFRPRPNDHIVEPVFAALRPEEEGAGEGRVEPGRARRGAGGGLKWKVALALIGLLALAWIVRSLAAG